MGGAQQVLSELFELRRALRERDAVNGKEPKICTDESLMDMAERLPSRKEDLLLIKGLGDAFVRNYGDDFLSVTRRYIRSESGSVPMDAVVSDALKDMERKLINISKGNPLLCSMRTVRSRTADMLSFTDDPLGMVFGGKSIVVDITDRKTFDRLNLIAREVLRDRREKGSDDLYVAYPFAVGGLAEDFPIRAPLALYPVRISKTRDRITLEYDGSRDALYNNALVLASMKYSGRRGHLPDPVVDEVRDDTGTILSFYSSNGLMIGDDPSPLSGFREYDADGLTSIDGLRLERCVVLGKFPLYSNSIQKDLESMASMEEVNGILRDIIEGDEGKDITDDGIPVSERDITYINPINSSQEKAVEAMRHSDALVVQGPPGTGKSQVMTAVITTALNEGRTVLMVSEKKTALDVVYSRLGHLSDYVMMVDDVTDKDLFYDQLKRMLGIDTSYTEPEGIDAISDEIESRLSELTSIADGMYRPDRFGVEPYLLYSLVKKVDLNDPEEHRRYMLLKDNITASLMSVSYPDLVLAYERFKERGTISDMRTYYQCLESYPWMACMRRDLSPVEIRSLRSELRDLSREYRETSSKGFLSRLFGKGQITRRATSIMSRYFTSFNEKYIEQMVNDPDGVAESLGSYGDYSERLASYEGLPRIQRMYGENLISVNTKMPSSYEMSNDELFAFIMMDHLRRFEDENQEILRRIDGFEDIRNDVDSLIVRKRQASVGRIGSMLRHEMRYLTESKMVDEISRIANSRRRWSINKFLNRFGSDVFRAVKVWLMTPDAVSELLPLEMGLFDLVVFDEASQMYVEKGIPSIFRAKKVMVAGDHMQLRPSSLGSGRVSFDDDVVEEDSLLDLARRRYDSVLLNFHYRSRYEELIAFSNYAFYGGRLYVSPNVDVPASPPIQVHRMEGARWEGKTNRKEASYIVGLLKDILSERKEEETIGIITFNIAQRDLIYDMIEDECSKDPVFEERVNKEMSRENNGEDIGLFLKNIESVQGDERDIIIFSIGYAKNEDGRIPKMFGWLNNQGGENRLNVAISRARKKIHIVTSFLPDELDVSDSKNEGPKLLKRYLEYSFAVSDDDREGTVGILDSFVTRETKPVDTSSVFNDQICEALKARGYDAEANFGIGGYSMDVAVRKGDRYVLGIECDNSLYAGAISTRERDYHRQKYFESRGWRVRRVWSNKWWNDPSKEIDDIIRILEAIQ